MKKFLLSLVFVLCIVALSVSASAKEYYIYTPEDMYNVRNDIEGTYYLMNDIDLSEYENWAPICKSNNVRCGVFEGNGYKITGLSINAKKEYPYEFPSSLGLFAYYNGTIKNLNLEGNINVELGYGAPYNVEEINVGGLVGYGNAYIDNCSSNIKITFGMDGSLDPKLCLNVGGLIGFLNDGTIKDCEVVCHINSNLTLEDSSKKTDWRFISSRIGGVAGYVSSGSIIENSHSSGEIVSIAKSSTGKGFEVSSYIGGLVGHSGYITVEKCYSICHINYHGNSCRFSIDHCVIGGLIGYDYNSKIKDCYTNVSINIYKYRGGSLVDRHGLLIGLADDYASKIENCYSTGICSVDIGGFHINNPPKEKIKECITNCYRLEKSCEIIGTALTASEMKIASNYAGFDFANTWEISPDVNNGYPYLKSNSAPLYIVRVFVNDVPMWFDVPPTLVEGRTFVPLRKIFEILGANVEWDGDTKTVTGTKDGTTIIMTVGQTTFTVNGKTKPLDVPAQIIDGRTLVPVRAIAESLGVNVLWNEEERAVYID